MPIIANLIVGVNGGTTIDGRSAPLSSAADRTRFHHLRERADLILIGGESSRTEPYAKTPVPLVVISRGSELSGPAALNPKALLSNADLASTLAVFQPHYSTILIEAGARLLEDGIRARLIDELFITKVSKSAEAPYFTINPLDHGLELRERLDGPTEAFLHYARLP
jgi:riboflavin biosynthesis pyrimidine reductase